MASRLDTFRQQLPEQLKSISDTQLLNQIYNEQYKGKMSVDEFYTRATLQQPDDFKPDPQPGMLQSALIGVGAGLTDIGSGIGQLLGFDVDQTRKDLDRFEQTPVGQSISGQVGKFIGQTAPTLAAPFAAGGSLLSRMAAGAATSGGLSGLQFVEGNDPQQRLKNIGIGAGIGGLIPGGIAAAKGIGKGLSTALPFVSGRPTQAFRKSQITEAINPKALQRAQEAKQLGVNLTPGEAANSQRLIAQELSSGTSRRGAETLESFNKTRNIQSNEAVNNLLKTISPNKGVNATDNLKNIATSVFNKKQSALQKRAAPFYRRSENDLIPEKQFKSLLDNPTYLKAYDAITKNPHIQSSIFKNAPNSIKVQDLVKKELWNMQQSAQKGGTEFGTPQNIGNVRKALTKLMTTNSPTYKKGLHIYSEDGAASSIVKLEKGLIGQLKDAKITTLEDLGDKLFKSKRSVTKNFKDNVKLLAGEDPAKWNQFLRQEITNKLGTKEASNLSTFSSVYLKSQNKFNQLLVALEHNPPAQSVLKQYRKLFSNLEHLGPKVTQGAVPSTPVVRQAIANRVSSILTGQYDKALVRTITDPKWIESASKILKQQISAKEKAGQFSDLLARITALQATEEQ